MAALPPLAVDLQNPLNHGAGGGGGAPLPLGDAPRLPVEAAPDPSLDGFLQDDRDGHS
jgi:hypothetical protein